MKILRMRFDAPLMSFGGVMVDQNSPTEYFPGRAMLTGLFANALGWYHGDSDQLQELQNRIEYAARWDIEPRPMLDYHTADLGLAWMREPGWTTMGAPEHRTGGPVAKYGTHQRYRHYWADGVMTVTVSLDGGLAPTTTEIGEHLRCPIRPLFLGRKTCIPGSPLFLDIVDERDVLNALMSADRVARPSSPASALMAACWPITIPPPSAASCREIIVYDSRDWKNQVHVGARKRYEGELTEGIL